MALSPDNVSMALFCDFENVALGVRDAKYDKFDIKRVLERLLLKGSIVVKKAYCDWERYRGFKGAMHEANFELIEIPHVRQSGKNSADIRLVVDALDLCYTKSHVNTFVIISGDSDFSPLVSKLRENAKQVIGVGVKQSTSDLLIANCDEFIFYDDLVREAQRDSARQQRRDAGEAPPKRTPEEDRRRREDQDKRQRKAFDLVMETFEALTAERGDGSKIRSSVLKDAIKRRRPDFNESYFGFRTFGALLDEAHSRGLLVLERDEKGNVYAQRGSAPVADPAALRQGLLEGGAIRSAGGAVEPQAPAIVSEPPPVALEELSAGVDLVLEPGDAEDVPGMGAAPQPDGAAPAPRKNARSRRGRGGRADGAEAPVDPAAPPHEARSGEASPSVAAPANDRALDAPAEPPVRPAAAPVAPADAPTVDGPADAANAAGKPARKRPARAPRSRNEPNAAGKTARKTPRGTPPKSGGDTDVQG